MEGLVVIVGTVAMAACGIAQRRRTSFQPDGVCDATMVLAAFWERWIAVAEVEEGDGWRPMNEKHVVPVCPPAVLPSVPFR